VTSDPRKWTIIGRNSVAKGAEAFSERNAKKSPENSLLLSRNRKKRMDFTQL